MQDLCFYLFALLTLLCGFLVVANPFSRNPVTSAMFLVLTIVSMAGLFVLLHAFFIAAVQVLVYAGAVMVLYLFVIMLIRVETVAKQAAYGRQWPIGLGAVLVLAAELIYGLYKGVESFRLGPPVRPPVDMNNTEAVAGLLYNNYMLPVEIASLLLLVAMVGAVLMAKKRFE